MFYTFQAVADDHSLREKLKEARRACQEDPKTKISEDYLKGHKKNVADEPNAKVHELCIDQKVGVIDAHGKVVKDVLKSSLSSVLREEAKLDAVITKCAVNKDTAEETAFALRDCLRKELKPPAGARRPPPEGHRPPPRHHD